MKATLTIIQTDADHGPPLSRDKKQQNNTKRGDMKKSWLGGTLAAIALLCVRLERPVPFLGGAVIQAAVLPRGHVRPRQAARSA